MKKIIFVLGGGIKKEPNGRWHSTSYSDAGDKFGLDGHRLRLEAAALLWKDEPESVIVVSGGKGQLAIIPGAPTVSSVMKDELVSMGVPEEAIIEENRSANTFENLKFMAEKVMELGGAEHVVIISNDYHLPRIKTMIEINHELKAFASSVFLEFSAAEDVLLGHDSKSWKEIIEKARASDAYKKRVELEKKGVEDIKSGRYQYKN